MATVLPSILAMDRETLVWVKQETTPFTEIKPTASDQLWLAGAGTVRQMRGFIPDPQRRDTYSQLQRFAGRFENGDMNFPILIKPSGSLGVAPVGGILLKALFGRETVTGGTKVEYFLLRTIDTRPTLTIWLKKGHFVYRAIGGLMSKGTFPLRADNSEDALLQLRAELVFAELKWTGTDELAIAIPSTGGGGETTMTLKNAKKYSVGSYVEIGANTNGGAGYQLTAIDYTTNVATFSPALVSTAVAVDSIVKPWVPAGSESGHVIHGRLGIATRGGVNLPLLSGSMSIDTKVKLLNAEKNGKDYADRFVHGSTRQLDLTAEEYFDANAARYFYEHNQATRGDVLFPWGDTAGKRLKLTAKNVELDAPEVSGNEEQVTSLKGIAFASSSLDDELVALLD